MSLFAELKRRNVIRVGLAYVVAGWLLAQVVELAVDAFEAPPWVLKLIVTMIVVGLVPVLIFSWVYELTPEGVKREVEVDRTESITPQTGQKLNVATIVLIVMALGVFAYDRFTSAPGVGPAPVGQVQPPATPVTDGPPSVAVLPFVNMSGNAENEYFSDGLTETLLHMLAQVDGLRVAARTSAFAFKGTNTDIREIAATLEVSSILEESVQRVGDRVRVTAQLIDARNGSHLWSQNFDRTLDDIFAIQDEIANSVAQALQVSLLGDTGSEKAAPKVLSVDTQNTAAYDLYLRGLQQYNRNTYTALPDAERLFKEALLEDPDFDEARVALVRAYISMQATGLLPPAEAASRGRAVLAPMVASDPVPIVAEALDAHMGLLAASFDYDADQMRELQSTLLRALALAPNEIELYDLAAKSIAYALGAEDREREQALGIVQRGLAIDPLSGGLLFTKAQLLRRIERYDEALAVFARIREVAPEDPSGYSGPVTVYEERGQFADVVRGYAEAMQHDRQDHELPAGAAQALLVMGLVPEAQPWIRRAQLLNPDGDDTRRVAMQYMAQSGDVDGALALAETLIREKRQNRRGVYRMAVSIYLNLMFHAGRLDEGLAFLEEMAPGVLAPDFAGSEDWWAGNIFPAAASYSSLDEGPDVKALRAKSLTEFFEGLGVNFDEAHIVRSFVMLLEGNRAAARDALVADLDEPPFPNWQMGIIENPFFEPILSEPEVQSALSRVHARMDAEAARYRAMVAAGEVVVP